MRQTCCVVGFFKKIRRLGGVCFSEVVVFLSPLLLGFGSPLAPKLHLSGSGRIASTVS